MNCVVIETPFRHGAPKYAEHRRYAMRALAHAREMGEAPLLDLCSEDHAWIRLSDYVAVYHDYGISLTMLAGLWTARVCGRPVAYRMIGQNDA